MVMRRPSSSEWSYLSATFPKLSSGNVWVTGEATTTYNCIAWTMGYTDRWINPASPLSAFEAQYARQGFVVTGPYGALIDGWGLSAAYMTHGSRQSSSVPGQGLWESKLGSSLRITHGRDELEGNLYGSILIHFNSGYRGMAESAEPQPTEARLEAMLNPDETSALEARAAEVDSALTDEFERRLSAWKASFHEHMTSSDTRDYATGPAYEALVSLGRPTLPLIMRHLADEDGFFLLPLLAEVEGPLTAEAAAADEAADPLEGERAKALRTLRRWLNS